MYNSRYQGFTPPTRPTVHAVTEQGKVKLYWDDVQSPQKTLLLAMLILKGTRFIKV